jgi:hypothetical protein
MRIPVFNSSSGVVLGVLPGFAVTVPETGWVACQNVPLTGCVSLPLGLRKLMRLFSGYLRY